MRHVIAVHAPATFHIARAETGVIGRYAGAYLDVEPSPVGEGRADGHHMGRPVDEHRQEVGLEPFSQVESPFVETLDIAVGRAASLGKDGDGIALVQEGAAILQTVVPPRVRHGEAVGVAQDGRHQRIVPHAAVRHQQDAGREDEEA